MNVKITFVVTQLILFIMTTHVAYSSDYLTYQQINQFHVKPADHRLHYGPDPMQFGDLRIPHTKGPHKVLIVIHGGCWVSNFANLEIMSPLADDFTHKGVATWNIEYRPVDKIGGGWPGTFLDIGKAIDYLKTISGIYHLDLDNVVVIGHSAGGHLGLWAGARHLLPKDSILYTSHPLKISGVVNLAGPGDLKSYFLMQKSNPEPRFCDACVVSKLLDSSCTELPLEKLKQTSPYELLPLTTKQILITGEDDPAVPIRLAHEYAHAAKEKGDDVQLMIIKNASHFEVIAPHSNVWPIVEEATLSLF